MKKVSLLSFAFIPFFAFSQKVTPAQIQKYLQQNIEITYYANPNVDKPKGVPRGGDELAKISNGIYFGEKNNNKMDKCAQLMQALFSPTKGDARLQETVYYALQLTPEPIDIYILNDKVKEIEVKYIGNFATLTLSGKTGVIISPATFQKSLTLNKPVIVLGEAALPGPAKTKELFCALAAQLCFDLAAPRRPHILLDIPWKGAVKQTVTLAYAVNDTRQLVSQALANAFAFYYSPALYKRVVKWSSLKSFTVSVSRFTGLATIPENVLLRNVILKAEPKLTGRSFTNPPWNFTDKVIKENRLYDESDITPQPNPGKFYFLNDIYTGLCFYEFLRVVGIEKFIAGIKWDNFRLQKAKTEDQLRIVFENLSYVMLSGKTYDDLMKPGVTSKNGEAFAIALFDLFGFIGIHGTKVTTYIEFSDAFKNITGGAFQVGNAGNPITYYLGKWQTTLQPLAGNIKIDPALGYYGSIADMIAKNMGIKP